MASLIERCRDQACDRPGRSERTTQLVALSIGHERERADRDHHRVPRPYLHERLRLPARRDVYAENQLVVSECVSFRADEELVEAH